jgi:hypothetical protein
MAITERRVGMKSIEVNAELIEKLLFRRPGSLIQRDRFNSCLDLGILSLRPSDLDLWSWLSDRPTHGFS